MTAARRLDARRPLFGSLRARWFLRQATERGADAEVSGSPMVVNRGTLELGRRFRLGSSPAQSHIVVGEGARLVAGDDVTVSYGAAISCQREVTIGDGCRIGPYSVIHDSDFHVAGDHHGQAELTPIHIGNHVRIGSRVTIMRGSVIGDRVTVLPGSVVSGRIADGLVVGGVPARAGGTADGSGEETDFLEVVMAALGLTHPPLPTDGPDQISSWDSLGALKLLLALEDAYGVSLGEAEMKQAQSVEGLRAVVEEARQRHE